MAQHSPDSSAQKPTLPQEDPPPRGTRAARALVGTMVGEYQVTDLIGEGGMGTVYSGVQPLIEKAVAIKVLKTALSDDPDVMERFLAEAKAVNRIQHPNIIDIFSFGQLEKGSQYYVMEYLPGRSLAAYLEDVKPVPYSVAFQILSQVLDALDAAHEHGIVHRDLKPDNIYLAEHPGGGVIVKLLDFGVAKFTEDGIQTGKTRTGVPIGTPRYMSPEQCRAEELDHRLDFYALGVIMFEMFTGRLPFEKDGIYALVEAHVSLPPPRPSSYAEVPAELERIILWCLEKDKSNRPGSAGELQQVLLPLLEQLSSAEEGFAPKRRHSTSGRQPVGLAETVADSQSGRSAPEPAPRGRVPVFAGMGLAIASTAVIVMLWAPWEGTEKKPAPSRDRQSRPVVMSPAMNAMEPAMRAGSQIAVPPPARSDRVNLQFLVSPSDAKHTIWVDGQKIDGQLAEVPRSKLRKVHIKITAKGFQTYEARPLPIASLTLQINLRRLVDPMAAMTMEPRRPPRRRMAPPRRRPPRRRTPADDKKRFGGDL